jgi:hypothetical protein
MCEAARAVEALSFETAVAEHLDYLGVFLAFLFEDEFALLVVVFVLASASVLTALLFVLGRAVWRGCVKMMYED